VAEIEDMKTVLEKIVLERNIAVMIGIVVMTGIAMKTLKLNQQ
jgi:hypothetical protein